MDTENVDGFNNPYIAYETYEGLDKIRALLDRNDFFHDADMQYFHLAEDGTASVTVKWEDDHLYTFCMTGIHDYHVAVDYLVNRWISEIVIDETEGSKSISFDGCGMYFKFDSVKVERSQDPLSRDARQIMNQMTSFNLMINNAWGMPKESWECALDASGKEYMCKHIIHSMTPGESEIVFGSAKKKDLAKKFRYCRVPEWSGTYRNDNVLDGYSWSMHLFSYEGCFTANGINGYPKYFDELCDYLSSLCE